MSIRLDLINQSTDTNNSQVIIFGESTESGDVVDSPLPVHQVLRLPAPGERVSVHFPGKRIALDVVGSESESPSEHRLPHLTLPDASSTIILVQGGGTIPIYFVVAPPREIVPDELEVPSTPHAPRGLLARLIAALRRIWRMITGG